MKYPPVLSRGSVNKVKRCRFAVTGNKKDLISKSVEMEGLLHPLSE